MVQGTAGTTEDQLKYSWNVALVISAGQSKDSLIPSPIMTSMERGELGRIEELTRCTSDVQDALISILSEKYINIPELKDAGVQVETLTCPGVGHAIAENGLRRGGAFLKDVLYGTTT